MILLFLNNSADGHETEYRGKHHGRHGYSKRVTAFTHETDELLSIYDHRIEFLYKQWTNSGRFSANQAAEQYEYPLNPVWCQ